jgi:hypothetical protein
MTNVSAVIRDSRFSCCSWRLRHPLRRAGGDLLRDPAAQRVSRDGKALRRNGQQVLCHLGPRGLGVQNQDLARRDVGKVFDLVLEQPVATADAG